METRPITLSVVIPAYNEEDRIPKTLSSVHQYLSRQSYAYEILVVDDGSNDRTATIVDEQREIYRNLKLLRLEKNQGKGWAVRTGMLQASGLYRLFMDADGSTSIEQLEPLLVELKNGTDIAVGSRHAPGSKIQVRQAPHREFLGYLFRNAVRLIFGMPINDTQNGFKAFRAKVAEQVFRFQHVRGWAFDVELLWIAKRLGHGLSEVPISWIDDDRSRVTFMAMPIMLMDLLKIRARPIQRTFRRAGASYEPAKLSFENNLVNTI